MAWELVSRTGSRSGLLPGQASLDAQGLLTLGAADAAALGLAPDSATPVTVAVLLDRARQRLALRARDPADPGYGVTLRWGNARHNSAKAAVGWALKLLTGGKVPRGRYPLVREENLVVLSLANDQGAPPATTRGNGQSARGLLTPLTISGASGSANNGDTCADCGGPRMGRGYRHRDGCAARPLVRHKA